MIKAEKLGEFEKKIYKSVKYRFLDIQNFQRILKNGNDDRFIREKYDLF